MSLYVWSNFVSLRARVEDFGCRPPIDGILANMVIHLILKLLSIKAW